ncbi:MAG: chitobiase/beta-hexosaminidase C-terminal domain-containing protein [Cyclobacteriaceae bacterium]|nr:chitobiase/beta-hexosaminidase C-terminal domain-containing protein [Cyclobacteriaceae bacterium]
MKPQTPHQSPVGFLKSLTLFVLFLTTFLFAFEHRIELPVWLQITGRLHPLLLHLPIGIIVLAILMLMVRTRFKSKQFTLLTTYLLLFATLSAAFTALFGLLLAMSGEYGATVQQHKVSGLVLAWFSYVVLWFYQSSSEIIALKHTGIVVLFALTIFTGHTGAELTHGENFIWEPLQAAAPAPDPETTSLYQVAVMPVLEKKCFACHNEKKAKGKLIMTVTEKFKQGGESGVAFIPGNPDSSRMIQFIHLPQAHDNHMPPDGKPQLSQPEIQLVSAWIKSSADFDKTLRDYPTDDPFVLLASNNFLYSKLAPAYTFRSASAAVIEKLNTPFRVVFPLHANSPALQADFFVKEYFETNALEELKQIEEQLISLNLAKMPVTDANLKLLSTFGNLEVLNLNFTLINGSGLGYLTNCKKLKSISLSGTKVTPESLKPILNLPQLQTVYIWNTAIDADAKAELAKSHPQLSFVHEIFTDNSTLALSKPILVNEGILKATDKIELKHTMPGVSIRYTIDSNPPDSVSGLLYDGPIPLVETVNLKAIACKPGWYCSKLLEVSVYQEGYKPLYTELHTAADKQYRGEGAASLTDSRKGYVDIFKEPAWLGFRDNNFEAGFDFGAQPPNLNKVVLSYGDNLGAYIFPPTEVQVWGGHSKDNLKLLMAQKFSEPKGYRTPHMSFITVNWETSSHSYYKIIAKPISKLPPWHGGKGQKGWFFVDEVFFY